MSEADGGISKSFMSEADGGISKCTEIAIILKHSGPNSSPIFCTRDSISPCPLLADCLAAARMTLPCDDPPFKCFASVSVATRRGEVPCGTRACRGASRRASKIESIFACKLFWPCRTFRKPWSVAASCRLVATSSPLVTASCSSIAYSRNATELS